MYKLVHQGTNDVLTIPWWFEQSLQKTSIDFYKFLAKYRSRSFFVYLSDAASCIVKFKKSWINIGIEYLSCAESELKSINVIVSRTIATGTMHISWDIQPWLVYIAGELGRWQPT